MAGKMGMSQNGLKRMDAFRLADLIKNLKQPQADWQQAVSYFTTAMQRPITKSNILGVCRDLDIDVDTIVAAYKSKTPVASLSKHVDELREEVLELRVEVAELKKRLGDDPTGVLFSS